MGMDMKEHRMWTAGEEKRLIRMYNVGLKRTVIQAKLGRSKQSVASKISKLGLRKSMKPNGRDFRTNICLDRGTNDAVNELAREMGIPRATLLKIMLRKALIQRMTFDELIADFPAEVGDWDAQKG